MGKKLFHVVVIPERCKECGICIAFCPQNNLAYGEDGRPVIIDPETCTGCRECVYYCPDFAVRIVEETDQRP